MRRSTEKTQSTRKLPPITEQPRRGSNPTEAATQFEPSTSYISSTSSKISETISVEDVITEQPRSMQHPSTIAENQTERSILAESNEQVKSKKRINFWNFLEPVSAMFGFGVNTKDSDTKKSPDPEIGMPQAVNPSLLHIKIPTADIPKSGTSITESDKLTDPNAPENFDTFLKSDFDLGIEDLQHKPRIFDKSKKYYEGNGDQFYCTTDLPPTDDEGFALFEPFQLGPDFCTIFKRMQNYKYRCEDHCFKPLEKEQMFCVRALPDVPVAIEFAPEVDCNARMRPRVFAICGQNMLPCYYAIEYTPIASAVLSCMLCATCCRQPYNLAVYGLDGKLAFRLESSILEYVMPLRYIKEWFCCCGAVPRMTMQFNDTTVFGTLYEFHDCCMTQWLQINPGAPKTKKKFRKTAFIQWQSKCRSCDFLMIYCGCKDDMDVVGNRIIFSEDSRKIATAAAWDGITSEDFAFFFTIRFAKRCPVELRLFTLASTLIYSNLNWESREDQDFCDLFTCLFCTCRTCEDCGPVRMDYDSWSMKPAIPATAFLPWKTVLRPTVVNHRRV